MMKPSIIFALAALLCVVATLINWDQTPVSCDKESCVMRDGSFRLSPENHTRYIDGKKVDLRTYKR